MQESVEFVNLRVAWKESGLAYHPEDIGTRPFHIVKDQYGIQISVEGSPIRGELVIRWIDSGDAVVWFRPYDTAFAYDFTRIGDKSSLLFALFPIVKYCYPNLRSLT